MQGNCLNDKIMHQNINTAAIFKLNYQGFARSIDPNCQYSNNCFQIKYTKYSPKFHLKECSIKELIKISMKQLLT